MPTIAGYRRRGFTAWLFAILPRGGRDQVQGGDRRQPVGKRHSRGAEQTAERRCAVLDPLEVVIENYPEGESEELEAVNNPEDERR